jgi:hypothetical protein
MRDFYSSCQIHLYTAGIQDCYEVFLNKDIFCLTQILYFIEAYMYSTRLGVCFLYSIRHFWKFESRCLARLRQLKLDQILDGQIQLYNKHRFIKKL